MKLTTATIEDTELSDNSNNNAAIVADLVNHHPIDFEAEFECLMIADIEDADADTMGQHEKVPRQCFFLLIMWTLME